MYHSYIKIYTSIFLYYCNNNILVVILRMDVSKIFRNQTHASPKPTTTQAKRDKLEQTKRRDRELKQQRKTELMRQKEEKADRIREAKGLLREERMLYHDTRKARADKRHALDKVDKVERRKNAPVCAHGITQCKLCCSRS